MQQATGRPHLVQPLRLVQYLALSALFALVALCNPYTLFGRDDGQYWAAAFVLPLALSAAYCGLLALARATGSMKPQAALSFMPLSALLQLLVLVVQWVDV